MQTIFTPQKRHQNKRRVWEEGFEQEEAGGIGECSEWQ